MTVTGCDCDTSREREFRKFRNLLIVVHFFIQKVPVLSRLVEILVGVRLATREP